MIYLGHGKSQIDSMHSILSRIANQYGIQGICNTAEELCECASKEETLKCPVRKNKQFERKFEVRKLF